MNGKKIALAVVLIAIIAVAAAVTVKRIREEQSGPTMYVDQKFEKIDMKTFEVFGETTGDWESRYAPNASGRYKNPKTGEYTMVDMIKCASCGKPIPMPMLPENLRPKSASGGPPGREASAAAAAALRTYELTYMCPLCGKNAFEPPPAAPSPVKKSKGPQAG